MALPSTIHQRILRKLVSKIDSYIFANHGNCEVFPAPFAVSLFGEESEKNHIKPDLLAQHFTFSDIIKVNIYDDFSIDFSQLNI